MDGRIEGLRVGERESAEGETERILIMVECSSLFFLPFFFSKKNPLISNEIYLYVVLATNPLLFPCVWELNGSHPPRCRCRKTCHNTGMQLKIQSP